LYFRLAFEPAVLEGFSSHFTVDISDTLDAKLKAVRCYQTQFPPAKEYVFERIRGAALIAGSVVAILLVTAVDVVGRFVNTRMGAKAQ